MIHFPDISITYCIIRVTFFQIYRAHPQKYKQTSIKKFFYTNIRVHPYYLKKTNSFLTFPTTQEQKRIIPTLFTMHYI